MTKTPVKKLPKDLELVEKAARRRFTAEYKRQIALEAEQCQQHGKIGALVRRKWLYSSVLTRWRRQLREGPLASLKKIRQQRLTHSSPRTRPFPTRD